MGREERDGRGARGWALGGPWTPNIQHGLLKQLQKRLLKKAMRAELTVHLLEIYGVEVSPVTEAVNADVQVWQDRPLEEVYPIVYFDAQHSKVRDNGQVARVAVDLALGVAMAGHKEVLYFSNSLLLGVPLPVLPPGPSGLPRPVTKSGIRTPI